MIYIYIWGWAFKSPIKSFQRWFAVRNAARLQTVRNAASSEFNRSGRSVFGIAGRQPGWVPDRLEIGSAHFRHRPCTFSKDILLDTFLASILLTFFCFSHICDVSFCLGQVIFRGTIKMDTYGMQVRELCARSAPRARRAISGSISKKCVLLR